tara:strand:- start:1733 stop:2242 length:510 start_codon:yes stop_codon:yes gene_type:complete
MVDAGISGQSAIGGFEHARGSKPRLLGLCIEGLLDDGGQHLYIDGNGTLVRNKANDTSADIAGSVVFGAGSITLSAVSSETVTGSWVIGSNENAGKESLDVFMAHGNFAFEDGATYDASSGTIQPGMCSITSINGGTVNFIVAPAIDSDTLGNDDGYRIQLWAYARGGV